MFLLSSFSFSFSFSISISISMHAFSDILYEPTAPCYVPRAEGAGALLFSVATIWRYIKQLCYHICSYICIPEMSDKLRYGPCFDPHINTCSIGRTSIDSSLFYS